MKAHLNLIVIMLALTASLYLGWRVTQPELTGHWHVHPAYQTSKDVLSGVHHFNVYGNGEIRINEVLHEEYVVTGYVDKLSRTMYLHEGCWYVGFQYRIRGDRMDIWYEDGEHSRWRPVAHRFRPGDCDPEQDYFTDLPIDLKLPIDHEGAFQNLPTTKVEYFVFHIGKVRFTESVRVMSGPWKEVRSREDLREHFSRRLNLIGPIVTDYPEGVIIYKDASITPDELRTALTDDLQSITSIDGYYLAHRNPNEEGLALTFRWVAF